MVFESQREIRVRTNWSRRLGGVLVAAATIGAPIAWLAGRADAAVPATVFTYTGAEQTYTVPAGVTMVHVAAIGGAGGAGQANTSSSTPAPGGHGGSASADVPVAPGETLYVEVGANGADGNADNGAHDGAFNGGGAVGGISSLGSQGGGGGGASDVRTCGRAVVNCSGALTTLTSRLIVAAGGGGGSADGLSGNGGAGGDAGQSGQPGVGADPSQAGRGATVDGPGAGGASIPLVPAGTSLPGNPGAFGQGGSDNASFDGGGTGGGGWFGGGSGAPDGAIVGQSFDASGGGGGSDYVVGNATNVSTGLDTAGTPQISITPIYQAPSALTLPASAVTKTGATLNGVVNPHEASTLFDFEYADDATFQANAEAPDPYDRRVALGSFVNGNDETVNAAVAGLKPGTEYHFRLHANGPGGTVDSLDQTFTTAPK